MGLLGVFKKKEERELMRALNKNKIPSVPYMSIISKIIDGVFTEFSVNITDFRLKELTDEYYLNNYLDIDWDVKDNYNGMKTVKCICNVDIEFMGSDNIPYHIYLKLESNGRYKLSAGLENSLKNAMYVYIKAIITENDVLCSIFPNNSKLPDYKDLVTLSKEHQYTGYSSKTIYNDESLSIRSVSNAKNDETSVIFKSTNEEKKYNTNIPSFIAETKAGIETEKK